MNEALIPWLMAPDAPEASVTPEDILHRPQWHQDAACRGVGVAPFVIPNEGRYSRRALCEGCQVRHDCLEAALADSDLVGLWGGATDAEGRELRRQQVA
jgi:WhiB family redox-sensing transcriptional regulator